MGERGRRHEQRPGPVETAGDGLPRREIDQRGIYQAALEAMRRALDCYVTYQQTFEEAGARRNIPREAVFEIYQEAHDPPLKSLVERWTEANVRADACGSEQSGLFARQRG